jgi:putative FmdB family regulatory protein
MPIYDYRCDHCGHAFSAVQSFKDDPLASCPNCGGRPRRLLSKPAIVFKGSGWYKTDSRGPAPASDASPKDGTSTTGTGDAKPSDTKAPATTAEKTTAPSSG